VTATGGGARRDWKQEEWEEEDRRRGTWYTDSTPVFYLSVGPSDAMKRSLLGRRTGRDNIQLETHS